MNDPSLPWLEQQCSGADSGAIAEAVAAWLARQEREPWLSPAFRITARLLQKEAHA